MGNICRNCEWRHDVEHLIFSEIIKLWRCSGIFPGLRSLHPIHPEGTPEISDCF